MLILNPLEKLKKMRTTKVININMKEICTFSTFTHFRQFSLLIAFLWCIFRNTFNGFEISMKFLIPRLTLKKKIN
jgi:hypothetical protein